VAWRFFTAGGVAKTGEYVELATPSNDYKVLGLHQLTSTTATTGTHTTMQDEGLTKSIVYGPSRVLRVSIQVHPYANPAQRIYFRLVRGSTGLIRFTTPTFVNAGRYESFFWSYVFNGPATAATETFKVQFAAIDANSAVESFGDATSPRVLLVEDLGPQ